MKKCLFFMLCFWGIQVNASDYFWIGGSGDWFDISHWATFSGGTFTQLVPPTSSDNVFFDSNSFTAPGQTVTVNGLLPAICSSMDWTDAAFNPTFFCTNDLNISGSLTLISNMTFNYSGYTHFDSKSFETITMAGNKFISAVFFNGRGSWTLQDKLDVSSDIYLVRGTIFTNGNALSVYNFRANSNLYNCTLDAGSSNIDCNGDFLVDNSSGSKFIFVKGTSTLNMLKNYAWLKVVGGLSFYKVNFNSNSRIYGNNTFNVLSFNIGSVDSLQVGATQTIIDSIVAHGDCHTPILFRSTKAGALANFLKTTGTIKINNVDLRDIGATGGAVFNDNEGKDNGNNFGWNFLAPKTRSLYWIGNVGNWTDEQHWSTSSGGVGGACIPTLADNVVIDDKSFNYNGASINIDAPADVKDFTWSASSNLGAWTGSKPLNVYGSFRLPGNLTDNYLGKINFAGTTLQTIDAGKYTFMDTVTFSGNNYSLSSALNVPNSPIYLLNGSLKTNSQAVSAQRLFSDNTNARELDLGNSVVQITGASSSKTDYVWNIKSSNFTMKPGGSTIDFSGANPSVFMGNALTYNKVFFSSITGKAVFNGSNTVVDSLWMSANGYILGDNTFGYLRFTPDYTYTLEHAKKQTILNKLQMKGNKCVGITLNSDLAGSAGIISKASGNVEADYVNFMDNTGTGGAAFYAGSHSVNNGGNSGWQFIAGPNQSVPYFGPDTLMLAGNALLLDGSSILGNSTTYQWYDRTSLPSVLSTNSTYNVTVPGRYWLTAIYKSGCTLGDTINVFYATIDSLSCHNSKDASILITYDNFYNYTLTWSNGLNVPFLNNIGAGNYSFTVNQLSSNERFVHTIKINQPDSVMIDSVKVKDVMGCFGDKTGGLTIYSHGGRPAYQYTINNGLNFSASNVFANLPSDTFKIFVKDKNVCPVATYKAFVSQPAVLKINSIAPTPSCSARGTGTITVGASGGTKPWKYSLDGLTFQTDSILKQVKSKIQTVYIKDAANCLSTGSVDVPLIPKPDVMVSAKDSVCKGDYLKIRNADATNFFDILWSTDGKGIFTDPTVFETTYIPAPNESGLFKLSLSVYGVCDTVVGVTSFMINNLPNLKLGNDTVICSNRAVLLNAGSGRKSYLWNDHSTASTLLAKTAGKYKVDVVDYTGCTASDSVVLSTNPIPDVRLPRDTMFCADYVKVLDPGSSYNSYLWQDGSKAQTLKARTTGLFWVEVSNQFNCKNRDSIQIVVNPLPKPNIGADTALCQGQSVTLRPGSFKSYLWQDGTLSSIYKINTTGLYWVEVTDANKCKNRDSMNLLVTPIPTVNLGHDTAICKGDQLVLDAGAGYQVYAWSNGWTQQKFIVNQAGTYSVTVKGLAACTATSTRTVAVNPVDPVNLGRDTTICINTAYLLKVPSTYQSYKWQNGWSADTMVISHAGYYWLQVTNQYGCPYRDTLAVGVEPYPQFSIGKDTSICFGQALFLSPGTGFKSYLWNTKETTTSIRAATTGTYTVTVWNRCGFTTKSMRLNVWPVPVADAGPDRVLCSGDTTTLRATGGISFLWSNGAKGDTTFIPQKTETYTVIVSDGRCASMDTVQIIVNKRPTIASVDVDVHADMTVNPGTGVKPFLYSLNGRQFVERNRFYSLPQGYYEVQMSDSSGCVAKYDSVFIKPTDEVYIPSAFTPNGDGVNDRWEIPGFKDKDNVQIQIFDQNGMLLVEYTGKDLGWDGKYHGVNMPSDAYWYLISINKQKFKTGYVALKR